MNLDKSPKFMSQFSNIKKKLKGLDYVKNYGSDQVR